MKEEDHKGPYVSKQESVSRTHGYGWIIGFIYRLKIPIGWFTARPVYKNLEVGETSKNSKVGLRISSLRTLLKVVDKKVHQVTTFG